LISLISPRWQSARSQSRKAGSASKRIAFLKLRRPLKLRPALSSCGTGGDESGSRCWVWGGGEGAVMVLIAFR
jgi:hypothetical protein